MILHTTKREKEFADLFSQYTKDINQLLTDREMTHIVAEKENISRMITVAQTVILRLAKKLPKEPQQKAKTDV